MSSPVGDIVTVESGEDSRTSTPRTHSEDLLGNSSPDSGRIHSGPPSPLYTGTPRRRSDTSGVSLDSPRVLSPEPLKPRVYLDSSDDHASSARWNQVVLNQILDSGLEESGHNSQSTDQENPERADQIESSVLHFPVQVTPSSSGLENYTSRVLISRVRTHSLPIARVFPAIQQPTDIATEAAVSDPGPPGDSEYLGEEIIVPDSPPEASAVLRQSSRFVSLSAPIGDTGVRSLAVNTSCRVPAKYHRARITGVVDKTETLFCQCQPGDPGPCECQSAIYSITLKLSARLNTENYMAPRL